MATAIYQGADSVTQGSWIGVYGSLGYKVPEIFAASLPDGVSVTVTGVGAAAWSYGGSTDVRALQFPGGGDRGISAWFDGTAFTVPVATAGPIQVALYFCDWDRADTRADLVEWIDAADGSTVLDSREVRTFHDGLWLTWTINGSLTARFTNLTPTEAAVISGFFFDSAIVPGPRSRLCAFDGRPGLVF